MNGPLSYQERAALLSVSVLGADWLRFGDAIEIAMKGGADLIQIDVADGVFAPTITFGEELVRRIRQVCNLPIEVHLMVSRPQDWISLLCDIGIDFILFHIEAVSCLHSTIEMVRRRNVGVGVVLNSETIPETVQYVLPYIDIVTLMAILPGFAGQPFIPETYHKIKRLRQIIEETNSSNVLIEVDGGVKQHNVVKLLDAGADILIVSSAIYGECNPVAAAIELKELMKHQPQETNKVTNIVSFLNRVKKRREL